MQLILFNCCDILPYISLSIIFTHYSYFDVFVFIYDSFLILVLKVVKYSTMGMLIFDLFVYLWC